MRRVSGGKAASYGGFDRDATFRLGFVTADYPSDADPAYNAGAAEAGM